MIDASKVHCHEATNRFVRPCIVIAASGGVDLVAGHSTWFEADISPKCELHTDQGRLPGCAVPRIHDPPAPFEEMSIATVDLLGRAARGTHQIHDARQRSAEVLVIILCPWRLPAVGPAIEPDVFHVVLCGSLDDGKKSTRGSSGDGHD